MTAEQTVFILNVISVFFLSLPVFIFPFLFLLHILDFRIDFSMILPMAGLFFTRSIRKGIFHYFLIYDILLLLYTDRNGGHRREQPVIVLKIIFAAMICMPLAYIFLLLIRNLASSAFKKK